MSKSLKKLIDINRLREFKNKLVGTDSPYVQTGAVDQTIAGTKTFSEPIVGSVTGSSGSCTGNAATATTATTAKACTGNAATATKLATARSLWGNNFDGSAAITGIITGTPAIELMPAATSNIGGYLDFHYNHSTADYTSRIIESASGTLSINDVTITTGKVVTATTFNGALKGNVTGNCSGSSGSCTGNAATATKLATARTIALSGAATGTATGFDGSGNITIPVTSLDASKLTGTASVSTTGNAATATTAATATNATYTNWLRTSSHSDHLFHTEWDGVYFWTYVTTGSGDYRAVRVARSDSAATAQACTGNAATATKATNGVDSSGAGWIRFINGIQICWASVPCGPSGSSRWTYGASFSSDPVVTVCDEGNDNRSVYLTKAAGIGRTSCLIVMVKESGGSHMSGNAQCIAIGEWK